MTQTDISKTKKDNNISFNYHQLFFGTAGFFYYLKSLISIVTRHNSYNPNYLLTASLVVFFHLACWSITLASVVLKNKKIKKCIGLSGWSLILIPYAISLLIVKHIPYYSIFMISLSLISITLITTVYTSETPGGVPDQAGSDQAKKPK